MTGRVHFPPDFEPHNTPLATFNVLETDTSVEEVWSRLIDAMAWPSLYGNCVDPKLDDGHNRLQLGTHFHWTTFGLRVHTTVQEFVPFERLAWSGETPGGKAYHGWVIERLEDGCRITTEETQRGFMPWLGRAPLSWMMHRQHQRWLLGLAAGRCV